MTDRNTKFVVSGVIIAVIGLVLGYTGLAPLTEPRDADGYYMSNALEVDRPSHAVVTSDVDLLRGRWETLTEETFILEFSDAPDDVRMQGLAAGPDELFIGIGPADDVETYLDEVGLDEITDWNADRNDIDEVEFTPQAGSRVPGSPATETFWVVSATGAETLTLDWTIEPGEWMVVVMNADASPGVTAELWFGALPPDILDPVAWTLAVVGIAALVVGGLLFVVGIRRQRRDRTRPDGTLEPPPPAREPVEVGS